MTTFAGKPHIRFRNGAPVVEYRVNQLSALSKGAITEWPWARPTPFYGYVQETEPGGWQRNLDRFDTPAITREAAVYRCISLISGDCAKLHPQLMEERADGTSQRVKSAGANFLRLLRKPNSYQTRSQFLRAWLVSKLVHGNVYILKQRDDLRGVVTALHVLDPCLVKPLVAESGEVFYRLGKDYLAELTDDEIIVPASEIVHDREICLWHPLVGVPPLMAAAIDAGQALSIHGNSVQFFANASRPSGVLTAPGKISDEVAKRLKEQWEANFSGSKIGKLAVLGDGLKYDPMTIPAVEAQLAEQLGLTVFGVARAFGVPPYKLGLASGMTYSNAGQGNQDYYSQCLQTYLDALQEHLYYALELPEVSDYKVWFNLDDLLLLDPLQQAEVDQKEMQSALLTPDEGRMKRNRPPVKGGDQPYMQQQMWQVGQLADRGAAPTAPETAPAPPAGKSLEESADVVELAAAIVTKFAEAA